MPFALSNPDSSPEELGVYPTMEELRRAAVAWFRAQYPESETEEVLLIASYIYSEENWARDPFGTVFYCHCSTRFHSDGDNITVEPPSFFARPV